MVTPRRGPIAFGVLFAAVLGAAAFAVLDPLGLVEALEAWLSPAAPATGPPEAVVRTVAARQQRVEGLSAVLTRDPVLSLALFAVGAGVGLVLGGLVGYVRESRQIRRGGTRE